LGASVALHRATLGDAVNGHGQARPSTFIWAPPYHRAVITGARAGSIWRQAGLAVFASQALAPWNGLVQRVTVSLALAAELLHATRILTLPASVVQRTNHFR
jgi:hypothetical protein